MTEINDYLNSGFEYDWIACDRRGNIAEFSNGSIANLPDVFSKNWKYFEDEMGPLVDYIYENLEEIGQARLGPTPTKHDSIIPNDANSLQQIAAKGLYQYDADLRHNGKTYYLTYYPSRHLTMSDLPEDIRILINKFRVDVEFRNKSSFSELEVRSFFDKKR